MDLLGVPEEFLPHVSEDGRRASLAYAGLTSVPEWLSTLTDLTELDLSANELTELPDWLGRLTALSQLDLGGNQLTELPDWIGNLTSLAVLDLRDNQLSTVPAQLDALLADGAEVMLEGNPLTDESPWLRSS